MAGYLPSYFVRIYKHAKKRTRPISSHLDRESLVNKGFIIWDKTPKHDLYTCGTKPVSRAGKISPSIHSDEGLTLETSVFEFYTVANLPYRP